MRISDSGYDAGACTAEPALNSDSGFNFASRVRNTDLGRLRSLNLCFPQHEPNIVHIDPFDDRLDLRAPHAAACRKSEVTTRINLTGGETQRRLGCRRTVTARSKVSSCVRSIIASSLVGSMPMTASCLLAVMAKLSEIVGSGGRLGSPAMRAKSISEGLRAHAVGRWSFHKGCNERGFGSCVIRGGRVGRDGGDELGTMLLGEVGEAVFRRVEVLDGLGEVRREHI